MAKGLSVPCYVNNGGGAKIESEENQLNKLIILALQEGEDENPFQEIGLDPAIIYRINDETAKYDAKTNIETILKSFDGRLKLNSDGVVISGEGNSPQDEEGEMNVGFKFIDLDTNVESEFATPFEELGDRL